MSSTGDAKNVWYLYQARRVATQANAAGGAIIVDISVAAGQIAKLVSLQILNSGTNSLYCYLYDEDVAESNRLGGVGSAAGNRLEFPSIGANANAAGNFASSEGLLLGPGQLLSVFQLGAGIQNDTLTVAVTLLLSTNTAPTWSKARSTNEADVTLAASTISTANTMQAVAI